MQPLVLRKKERYFVLKNSKYRAVNAENIISVVEASKRTKEGNAKALPSLHFFFLFFGEVFVKLNHHLNILCNRNCDGAYATQANRKSSLQRCAKDLKEIGFNQVNSLHSLKPKHIESLVKHWQINDLSVGTIKNRMSNLRWVAEKINRPHIIAKDNSYYGIEDRSFVGKNKALDFTQEAINAITDKHIQASAMMQKAFGLRREEAMKICPVKADAGNKLILTRTWCKGGRSREIEIRNDAQRQALEHAKSIAKNGSLIPGNLTYFKQMKRFENEMRRVGLGQTHGARHAFAQDRYKSITGWFSPAQGGPKYKDMSDADKAIDRSARLLLSKELGHVRLQIVATYING